MMPIIINILSCNGKLFSKIFVSSIRFDINTINNNSNNNLLQLLPLLL